MKKAIITVFLLLCIALTGAYSVLYILFTLPGPSEGINRTHRKYVLRYPLIRKALKLRQAGDARYEYAYDRFLPIEIRVFYQEGVLLEPETLGRIAREIQWVTHKAVKIKQYKPITLRGIPDKVSDENIYTIISSYGTSPRLFVRSIPLNIFILRYYLPVPSYAGLVVNDTSMILFKTAIENAASDPQSLQALEISTILHEFAHLAGAEHIENPDCIMADTVENLNFYSKISQIRDTYCEEDRRAIQEALEI